MKSVYLGRWRDVTELVWYDERAVFYSVNKGDQVSIRSITPTDVRRLMASYGTRAGLAPLCGKGRLGAHDVRRTCACNGYDNGATLLQLQRLLGHADPGTTAPYIGLDRDGTETTADHVKYWGVTKTIHS